MGAGPIQPVITEFTCRPVRADKLCLCPRSGRAMRGSDNPRLAEETDLAPLLANWRDYAGCAGFFCR